MGHSPGLRYLILRNLRIPSRESPTDRFDQPFESTQKLESLVDRIRSDGYSNDSGTRTRPSGSQWEQGMIPVAGLIPGAGLWLGRQSQRTAQQGMGQVWDWFRVMDASTAYALIVRLDCLPSHSLGIHTCIFLVYFFLNFLISVMCQTGRFKRLKLDGSKDLNWMVQKT